MSFWNPTKVFQRARDNITEHTGFCKYPVCQFLFLHTGLLLLFCIVPPLLWLHRFLHWVKVRPSLSPGSLLTLNSCPQQGKGRRTMGASLWLTLFGFISVVSSLNPDDPNVCSHWERSVTQKPELWMSSPSLGRHVLTGLSQILTQHFLSKS